MALRCLLVSLVASLGFEMPSGQDVTSLSMLGQNWVSARTVDLSALGAEASGWLGLNDPTIAPKVVELAAIKPLPAVNVETVASIPADLVFDSIIDGTALAFVDDSQSALPGEATALVASTQLTSSDDETGLTGSPDSLCLGEPETLILAFPATKAEAITDEANEPVEAPLAPVDRLTSAVRLTREAVQAWASLVQAVNGETTLTR